MRIIGYFSGCLTVAECQQIRVIKDEHREEYEILAEGMSGVSFYVIRPAAEDSCGYKRLTSMREANEMLEWILSVEVDGIIDLRRFDDLYCTMYKQSPSVLVSSDWDEMTDSPMPVYVKSMKYDG